MNQKIQHQTNAIGKQIRIVRYEKSSHAAWGVLHDDRVVPLDAAYETTGALLRNGMDDIQSAASRVGTLQLANLDLLSPVTQNQQFVCQGVNYEAHLKESGISREDLPFNTIFTKASSCISKPNTPIVRPAHVRLLDYEAELGLVMGTDITSSTVVTPETMGNYIAGLVIVNDISARDVQLPQGQFYKGKSYRTFGPVGPYLTLLPAKLMQRMLDLHLQLSVNGKSRQDFFAREMIYKPHETLTELSQIQDLFVGDLIATGTSSGVAAKSPGKLLVTIARILMNERKKWQAFVKRGVSNPLYLQPGDKLITSIRTDDGAIDLGTQRNTVVAATTTA
jgi:2,4-didehydro-3-deoxy-L-rhamnonate hydrolase